MSLLAASHTGHLGFFDIPDRHGHAVPPASILQFRHGSLIASRLVGPVVTQSWADISFNPILAPARQMVPSFGASFSR